MDDYILDKVIEKRGKAEPSKRREYIEFYNLGIDGLFTDAGDGSNQDINDKGKKAPVVMAALRHSVLWGARDCHGDAR